MRTLTSHLRLAVAAMLVLLATSAVSSARQAGPQESLLATQDVLNITVWGQADLSGKFTVEADGTFAFPLIGRVKAAGIPRREVEETVARRLADGYLRNPQVAVSVEPHGSQSVNVVGEVRQAGSFPFARGMTLAEVLARAGSTTDAAGSSVLVSRRPDESDEGSTGERSVVRVDVRALQSGEESANLLLRAGDTVFVPRAERIYVLGAVKSPGSYPVQEQTTVLQALALAGGLTDRGSMKGVRVVRKVDGVSQTIKVKLDALLRPGDTVMVGERLF